MLLKILVRVFVFLILMAAIGMTAISVAMAGPTVKQERLINKYAKKYNLDPKLLTAIAEVESKFNSHAVGDLGELGLFQLRPEFHPTVKEGDDRSNIEAAAKYLAYVKDRCEPTYGDAWFVCFNHGQNKRLLAPKVSTYYKRVITLYRSND